MTQDLSTIESVLRNIEQRDLVSLTAKQFEVKDKLRSRNLTIDDYQALLFDIGTLIEGERDSGKHIVLLTDLTAGGNGEYHPLAGFQGYQSADTEDLYLNRWQGSSGLIDQYGQPIMSIASEESDNREVIPNSFSRLVGSNFEPIDISDLNSKFIRIDKNERFGIGFPLISRVKSKNGDESEEVFGFYHRELKEIPKVEFSKLAQRAYLMQNLLIDNVATGLDHMILRNKDPLTKVYNRAAYDDDIEEKVKSYSGRNKNLGLVYVDIDLFKQINDNYGHPGGDVVLREIANVLQSNVRKTDRVYRIGGDEFAIIINDTEDQLVGETCQRILTGVQKLEPVYEGRTIPTTITMGYSIFPTQVTGNASDVIRATDLALYAAKNGDVGGGDGRNRVVSYGQAFDSLPPPGR